MKIDLSLLNNGIKKEININENIIFGKEDLKNTSIVEMEPVIVEGKINKLNDELFHLYLYIATTLCLEDSNTLEIIKYPVKIIIDKTLGNSDDEDNYYRIFENTLDIIPIVWENIVLEVPLRIVKEESDLVIEGDGWSLNKLESENPLSELNELLDMEGKE